MNILNALKQLRDDIKTWITVNLNALNAKIDEKTIPIDSELSATSTNPVQNQVITKEIDSINDRVGDTPVATQISNAIDKVPTFSGDYNDLTNAPDISEDGSGNMIIADESGNIIFKADADGIHTTAVSLNGEAAASEKYVDEAIATKVDFTGYATEEQLDNLRKEIGEGIESDAEDWKIIDEAGNIIFRVDKDGTHTTSMTLNGKEVATKEYVEGIIPEVDLTGYATEEYVDEAVANIDIPDVDFTGYATEDFVTGAIDSAKEELSESIVTESDEWKVVDEAGNIIFSVDATGAHTTELTLNGENAATESYVDEAIAQIPKPDLTDYATKKYVDDAVDGVDFTGYATETYVDNKVADLVNSAPEALNTLGELAAALENHEDAYDALLETVGGKATHTDLENLKEELSESITAEAEDWKVVDGNGNIIFSVDNTGAHTISLTLNGEEAATKTYVNEAISDIEFPEADFTGYATEKYVDEAIAAIPQTDLTGYATEKYVDDAIAAIPETDFTGYATEDFVGTAIDSAKEELSESIVAESKEWKVVDEAGNIIFSVDATGAHTTELTLNGENAATESYVDNAIENIEFPTTDLTNYATKKYVDDAVDGIEIPSLDGYATETYVDNKVADLVNSAPEALNTLGELATALENHEDAYDALLETVGSKATHTDLENLKEELSESIVSETDEWKVVDENGNIIFSVDATGAHTTSMTLNGQSVEDMIDDKVDKVDGKGLSTNDFTNEYKEKLDGLENITFEESDPTVPAWAKAGTKPSYTASEVGAVPTSRTVNGKALSENISLSASDVGALPNTVVIPDALSDLTDDATHRTVTDAEKEAWNAKSNFSGKYEDLTGQPDIPDVANYYTKTEVDSKTSHSGSGPSSIALGNYANAAGPSSIALGSAAKANGEYSTALGSYAKANSISSTALGSSAKANGEMSTALGYYANAAGLSSTALGNSATATGNSSTALGNSATATGNYSIALGNSATANGSSSTAVGDSAKANGSSSTALGGLAIANGEYSTALGRSATANGKYSTALGSRATAPGNYSIALGYGANVPKTVSNAIYLGNANIQTIAAAVTTITSLSDERTKEDIQLANTAQCLADIESVPVHRFKYKKFARYAPKDVHITEFIAQDVAKVFPKSIHTYDEEFPVLDENDEPIMITELDENGNIVYEADGVTERKVEKKFTIEQVMHMDKNFAIPTMWAAIQELSKRIKELETIIKGE